MSTPYVLERQVEYWTSRAIEDFYWDAGYECLTFPLGPHAETYIPADFVFRAGNTVKLYGLQYKTLYMRTPPYWKLDSAQHSQLQQFPWIYYALFDLRATREFRNSLHALRLRRSDFTFIAEPTASDIRALSYMRWWGFHRRLETCDEGELVRDEAEFQNLFIPVWDSAVAAREADRMADLFLDNISSRRVVRFSALLAPTAQ